MSKNAAHRFYVVMPVGSDPNHQWKVQIIEGVAKSINFEPHFPLAALTGRGPSTKDTMDAMAASDFVLADLSLERPSCYYELGLAQALGKRSVLVAEKGTTVHQTGDDSDLRYYASRDEYERVVVELLTKAALAVSATKG